MDKFIINGPCKIEGTIKLSGSKNASLPILAATILFDEPVELKNLPNVKDISTIENLHKFSNEDVKKCLSLVAYKQWSLDEISQGIPFDYYI